MESYDEDDLVKQGDKKDKDDTIMKHKSLKNRHVEAVMRQTFDKMKYMLDCGFNLLVYGVGSRYKLLNLFYQKHLSKYPMIQFNAYLSSCTMKNFLKELQAYIERHIFKGQISNQERQQ